MIKGVWGYVIAAALIFAAGFGLAAVVSDQKVAALQQFSDSLAAANVAARHAATRFADSARAVVDSLQRAKRPVTVRITRDSVLADSAARAVARAKTTADSNAALVAQVAAQASEIMGLKKNALTDSLSIWVAIRRGDSLQTAFNAQAERLVALNARIQELTPRASRALRVVRDAGELIGVFYAGVKWGQHHP